MASLQELQELTLGARKKRYLTSADGAVTGVDAYAIIPMEASTRLADITDASIADAASKTRLLAITSLAAPHYGQITAVQVSTGTICLLLH